MQGVPSPGATALNPDTALKLIASSHIVQNSDELELSPRDPREHWSMGVFLQFHKKESMAVIQVTRQIIFINVEIASREGGSATRRIEHLADFGNQGFNLKRLLNKLDAFTDDKLALGKKAKGRRAGDILDFYWIFSYHRLRGTCDIYHK